MNKQYLGECLEYNPDTGVITWKARPRHHFNTDRGYNTFVSQKVGMVTGCRSTTRDGLCYLKIAINKKLYLAHRLAWVLYHGPIPSGVEVDHIDHDGTNNKINNLRLVTSSQNKMNRTITSVNKSGCMGVYFNSNTSKWIAEIVCNGKYYGLGSFLEKKDAIGARKKAEIDLGFHKNHGGEKIDIS